jgi:hypothetical protein
MRASKEGTAASRSGKFKSEQEWGKQCFEDLDHQRLGRPATHTWCTDFFLREGSSKEEIRTWLKNKSIPWQLRRRLLQVVTGTFPCGQQMCKYGYNRTAGCTLCQQEYERSGSSWNGELPRETIGHIQSAGCLGQREVVIVAHNACIREDQEECNQFCSKEELWESVRDEEMKIQWKVASEGQPPTEEHYQERFWRPRLDGICLDVVTKEFLAIEFKRTQDMRSNHVDEVTAVAQKQYKNLLMGLQSISQNKGWKVQQLVFVGGTCGSVHVESFNSNMKALGVLESKWDLIRRKLVR